MVGWVSKLLSLDEFFKGRHFDAEIIVLCVRWSFSTNSHTEISPK
jgi:hypothetical protein